MSSSKLSYLSKYTSEVENGSEKKKKKKKKKKHKKDPSSHVQDIDLDVGMPSPPPNDEEEEDDGPLVVVENEESSSYQVQKPVSSWKSDDEDETTTQRRRRRHDSSSEEETVPRRRHDSDDDEEPQGRKRRHDSSDDESVPRRRRYDSDDDDKDPPQRRRHDSSEEEEEEKGGRSRRRYDSDDDEPKEEPPRRRRRHDSDDDDSEDGSRNRRRRYDSDDDDANNEKETMSSGHRAGLQKAEDFRHAETKLQQRKRKEAQAMVDKHGMGETVYRDEKGRKVDAKDVKDKRQLQQLDAKAQAELNKGRVQKQQEEADQREREYLQQASFARHKDDSRLEDQLRDVIRAEDPMAAQAVKKRAQTAAASGRPQRPVYKGPAPKPNRYGIRPGYRWDGVDRGNGFEDKVLARKFSAQRKKEDAYRWSSADM